MLFRRIGRIALTLFLCGSPCGFASAQTELVQPLAQPIPSQTDTDGTAGFTRTRPTGLLRLLAATQPIADPQLEESDGPPASADSAAQPSPLTPGGGSLEWVNPHEYGPAIVPERSFWKRWMPTGMDPWGPRTPLADRSTGSGIPLTTTSWLNRPYTAGWFAGGVVGPPLLHGVNQQGGFFGGYRLGWDYDYYWGVEARMAGAEIGLSEPGIPNTVLTAGYFLLDANLLYYPWGDCAVRPYASLGLGLSNVGFYDASGHRYDPTLLGLPIGVGVKYYWTPRFIFRADLTDNLGFGGPINVVSNFSFTGGIEVRFGGPRRSYWPWNPGRTIW